MGIRWWRRPAHDSYERLLTNPADPPAGHQPLARLIAGATQPARPDELAGEKAAMSAFRAARDGHTFPTPTPAPRGRRLTTSAAAWIAVTTMAAATTGAAVMAGAAIIDNPTTPRPGVTSLAAPTHPSPPTRPVRPSTTRTPPPAPSVTPKARTSPPGDVPSIPPSFSGLCRAYLNWSEAVRERARDNPALQRLIKAAGSQDQLTAYCRRLLASTATTPRSPGRGPARAVV